ncbi:MAG: peptidase MA family metallohydrolase [Limisphaerales bacterium]
MRLLFEGMLPRKNSLRIALPWPAGLGLAGVVFFLFASPGKAQSLDLSQQDFLRGRYETVIKTAQDKVDAAPYREEWRVLLVKVLLTVGRYHDAHTNAMAGLADGGGGLELRLLARQTSLFQGDPADAAHQLSSLKSLIEERLGYFQSEEAVPLGEALLLLGMDPKLVLENCFRRAENITPPIREAFLASGCLGLEKHDYALAAERFRAGLKKFPDDPEMEGGLAQAFATGDQEQMLNHIHAALAVNPHHIPTLLLLADYLVDAEKYDEAEKQLALVLGINPHRPEALACRSVLAELRNDPTAAQEFRAEALQYWTNNPQVDYLIGQKLARKYRFVEAAAAERRALAFSPSYLPASHELAEDLLRLGQTDEGWKLAQAVHAQDGFDVTAYNLATLHDQMEKFETVTNQWFIVHMSRHEAEMYGDAVLDLLSRARQTLCRKYGVELTQPTTVDIFPEQKDFAVRTFGMPGNPGYLGVCFGSVITANSPASQAPNPANWEDVLWHEFCHVVTLNETKNRMPRWLSEGISVYEERQANPTWGERMDLDYRATILDRDLTPLGELSGAFLAPKNPKDLQFAYYESSLVVDFLVQRYGLDTLKTILHDLGDGAEINQAITSHTAPLSELERQFAEFAREKALALAPNADLDKPPAKAPAAELAAWDLLHPHNYYRKIEEAEKLMEAKRWADAKPVLEALAASYAGEHRGDNPLWLLAATERNLQQTNAERATLAKLASRESDFVDLEIRLIELYSAQKDWPAVIDHANRLLAINPLISTPYRALAAAGVAAGRTDVATGAYRHLLLLDPTDPAQAHYDLARLLHSRGGVESEAKRHLLQALEEAPRFRDAQRLLLEIEGDKAAAALSQNPTYTPAK